MRAARRARRGRDDRAQPLVPQRRRGARVGRRDRRCLPARDRLPLYAKLSPAVPDVGALARAVEDAGADGLSLVNTIRGLALDEGLRPVLGTATGGYSGPRSSRSRWRPSTPRSSATELPIVGMGGVSTGRDALELIGAGASAVALGNGAVLRSGRPSTRPRGARRGARAPRVRIAGRGAGSRSPHAAGTPNV